MSRIFISYRRVDQPHAAARIYDQIAARFGDGSVFKDVDNLPPGVDFRKVLERALERCETTLVVIGRGWLECRAPDGLRRLDHPADFVRLEVERSLARDIPVIPVLVDGAPLPRPDDLPASLRDLCYRQAFELPADPLFKRAVDQLADALVRLLGGDTGSAPTRVAATATRAAPPPEPEVPGFSALGEETFTCPNDVEGPKQFRVRVFRCDAFARAIGLAAGTRAPDTEFVLLPPAGTPVMARIGSPASEAERSDDEDARTVEIAPFLVARTAMSQRVYDALGGEHEAYGFPGPRNPVENVSWDEANAWCDGVGLRLPTELEWEYACRGGTLTPFCFGSTITTNQANYDGNYPYPVGKSKGANRGRTVPVASLPPNAYGLFEVHGNVWEWCADLYPGSSYRVCRGGCWRDHARYCRSANRCGSDSTRRRDYLSFRPSRSYP